MYTINTLKLPLALFLIVALALITAGCSQNQIVASVDATITAVELALPLLSGTVPAEVLTYVGTWLNGAADALNHVVAEVNSPDPAGVQAAKIASLLAAYTEPKLPPGTPQAIATAVQAIAGKIADIIASFPKTATAANQAKPKLTSKESAALAQMPARLHAIKERLKAYQRK